MNSVILYTGSPEFSWDFKIGCLCFLFHELGRYQLVFYTVGCDVHDYTVGCDVHDYTVGCDVHDYTVGCDVHDYTVACDVHDYTVDCDVHDYIFTKANIRAVR